MKIIFPGLRKDNGAVSITTEALVELRAAFQKMKGQELRAALEEVVLFAKYLLENLKSPKAANALLDVANAAVSAGAFAPAGAPAWKSSKK